MSKKSIIFLAMAACWFVFCLIGYVLRIVIKLEQHAVSGAHLSQEKLFQYNLDFYTGNAILPAIACVVIAFPLVILAVFTLKD